MAYESASLVKTKIQNFTGTGDIDFSKTSAKPGFLNIINTPVRGDYVEYHMRNIDNMPEWESGVLWVDDFGQTLKREGVSTSSNSNSKVDFTSGEKIITCGPTPDFYEYSTTGIKSYHHNNSGGITSGNKKFLIGHFGGVQRIKQYNAIRYPSGSSSLDIRLRRGSEASYNTNFLSGDSTIDDDSTYQGAIAGATSDEYFGVAGFEEVWVDVTNVNGSPTDLIVGVEYEDYSTYEWHT